MTWGSLGYGMLLSLQAYQVYVSSVLQFVAQLEPLPVDFERAAVRQLFRGPAGWTRPTVGLPLLGAEPDPDTPCPEYENNFGTYDDPFDEG